MSAHPQSSLRLLAPALLAVFAIVFLIVVIASLGGDDGSSSAERSSAANGESNARPSRRREPRTVTRDNGNPRFYTVRAGDNLALIADRTGVTLADLRALNPSLDPQALVTGQRVRLRASSGASGSTGPTGAQGSTGAQGGPE